MGSCIIIADRLALTAAHVAHEINDKLSRTPVMKGLQAPDYHISVMTVGSQLPFGVAGVALCPWSDLAILYLQPSNGNDDEFMFDKLEMSFALPQPGDIVTVWGVKNQQFRINADGSADVGGHPLRSIGPVLDVHEFGRDQYMLTWPVASARIHSMGGMSGGPVFNSRGQLCGLCCSSLDGPESENDPLTYFSLLWPLLPVHMRIPREDLPVGTRYAFRNLIETGFVAASGWADPWLSKESAVWGKLRPYGDPVV